MKIKKRDIMILCGVVLVLVLVLLLVKSCSGPDLPDVPDSSVTEPQNPTESETEPPVESQPENTEPQILPHMAELLAQNPDFAYWVEIEGTVLDYPVMYTPTDREKYLHKGFDQKYSFSGMPFLDSNCMIDPESDNLIIYGHNMGNGTMFRTLMSYTDEAFFQEHPQVKFTTMYEERTYDILAVFYDRVYYKYEDVFKFYKFIDAEDEADYNEAISYYKEHSIYDTGVTAEYGDRLLTLVTCAYHEENGRFVVVARQRVDKPEQPDAP